MIQENPEIVPNGNLHFDKSSTIPGSSSGFIIASNISNANDNIFEHTVQNDTESLFHDDVTSVSIDDINGLNLIFNDNDCGNAFFNEICESLKDKGLQIITSKQNDNLMYDNSTVITLDQQMIAGEGVAFIGPCQTGTANHSEALLKSMQMTFNQRGWDTDCLAGVMQYVPYHDDEIYKAVPSDTEKAVVPGSSFITLSFGTMPDGFKSQDVTDDILLSLARYQHYLSYDSENVTVVSNPRVPKSSNDNHYFFNEQINRAPSFNPQLIFDVSKETHYSK